MPVATLVVRISAQLAEFQKAFADTSKTVQKFAGEFEGVATRAAAVGSFFGNIASGIARSFAQGIGTAIRDAVRLSSEFANAFLGLSSVARAFGTDANRAKDAARSLSADGLMPLKDSATGLKNLLASGFNLQQSVQLMNAFKDSAAFGRQGALSFGEAVATATSGIKSGNSILVDNAGVTKNLSQILKEAGFSAQDLSRASSDVSVRMALFNGILKETRAQTGDAAKLAETYSGQVSRLSTSYDTLLGTLGDVITQNRSVAMAVGAVGDVFRDLTIGLTENKAGFNLVSDAVLIIAKSFSTVLDLVDLVQTGFAGLQTVSNRLFQGIANIGIAMFKVAERAASLQKYLDPLNWKRHQAAVDEARGAYTWLEGAVEGFRDASTDATTRSISWGNALQGARARVDALAVQIEASRGETVEFGEAATQATDAASAGFAKAGRDVSSFLKKLLELDTQIANRKDLAEPAIVERFGRESSKLVEDARDLGLALGAIPPRIRAIADAWQHAQLGEALAKVFGQANEQMRRMAETIVEDQAKATTRAQERSNEAFVDGLDAELDALRDNVKLRDGLEDDSLEHRLAAVHDEYAKQRQALQSRTGDHSAALKVIDETERLAAEAATEAWEQHVADVRAQVQTYPRIFEQALAGIPNLIQSALTGGDVKGAGQSLISSLGGGLGGKLFGDLASKLSGGLFKLFGSNITSMLGTLLPGIGTAIGAFAGPLLAKLGGALKNLFGLGTAGRDLVKDFVGKNFGGDFDALHKRLLMVDADGEAMWKALTQGVGRNNPQQAQAAIDRITAALEKADAKEKQFNTDLQGMLQQVQKLGGTIPDALRPLLQQLQESGRLTQDNIDLLAQLSGDGTVSWEQMQEAAGRYGITLDELGQGFQTQRLHAGWQQLIDDADLLLRGGTGLGEMLHGMSDEISALVNESVKFGTDIPENMRPWIQMLIDTGQLLDENGQAITDISRLTFGESLQTSVQNLIDKISELIDSFGDAGDAAARLPRSIDVDVNYHEGTRPTPTVQEPAFAAVGGVVTAAGRILPQYLGAGGPVAWTPRGTDTVAAMLTPGEHVVPDDQWKAMAQARQWLATAATAGLLTMQAATGSQMPARESAGTVYNIQRGAFDGVFRGAVIDSPETMDHFADKLVEMLNKGGARQTRFRRAIRVE